MIEQRRISAEQDRHTALEMPKRTQMRPGIPGVNEKGVRIPSLYFVRQCRRIQSAEMTQPGPLRDVGYELVRVAIEQRDVPFHFGAKPMIEQGAIGRLRPGKEHAKIKRLIRSECPKDRSVVLYWVRAEDR